MLKRTILFFSLGIFKEVFGFVLRQDFFGKEVDFKEVLVNSYNLGYCFKFSGWGGILLMKMESFIGSSDSSSYWLRSLNSRVVIILFGTAHPIKFNLIKNAYYISLGGLFHGSRKLSCFLQILIAVVSIIWNSLYLY